MKIRKFLAVVLGALAGFAELALASKAEFGELTTIPGLTAAASLNNHQFGVVRFAAATTVNICSEVLASAATKAPLGVLQNKPYAGEAAQVAIFGLSKVRAGGTITAGAPLSYNSSGHVVDAVSGDMVIGRGMQAATVANTFVLALIFPPVRWGSVA
jgi:hypothetical protein